MNSLWKDLLFLHGHLVHKEDLDWHPETPADPPQDRKNGHIKRAVLACCAHVWPRIVSPR